MLPVRLWLVCVSVKGNHGLFSHVRSLPARSFWRHAPPQDRTHHASDGHRTGSQPALFRCGSGGEESKTYMWTDWHKRKQTVNALWWFCRRGGVWEFDEPESVRYEESAASHPQWQRVWGWEKQWVFTSYFFFSYHQIMLVFFTFSLLKDFWCCKGVIWVCISALRWFKSARIVCITSRPYYINQTSEILDVTWLVELVN